MRFFRWIYDALAVIGASAIGLLIVAVAADYAQQWYWRTFRDDRGASVSVVQTPPAATPVESTPPVATPVTTKPELPPYTGLPFGLDVAAPNGRVQNANIRLRITVEGQRVPGFRNAWVETHGSDLYLLVSQDSILFSRPPRGTQWALQLSGNRSTRISTYGRADGERFAYVRLCRPPRDQSLFVTTQPRISVDSQRSEWSVKCH